MTAPEKHLEDLEQRLRELFNQLEELHNAEPEVPDDAELGPNGSEPGTEPPGQNPLAEQVEPDSPNRTRQFLRRHRGSAVCVGTESFLLWVLLGLLGDGSPAQGDRLEGSAAMFDDLAVRVAAFDPNAGWRGGAAHAYRACTRAQSQHATLIADLDRLTAQLMSSQAQAVKDTRRLVSVGIGLVWVSLLCCVALESTGEPWAEAMSFYIAIAACGVALLVTGIALGDLKRTTSGNAHDMQAVAQRGSDLVGALPPGARAALGRPALAPPDAGLAPAEGVSQFALADHTAPSPLTAELGSALAGLPGAPEFHLATEAGAGLTDFGAAGLPVPPLTGMPIRHDVSDLSGLADVSGVLAGVSAIAPLSTTLSQLGGLAGPTNAASQLANIATQHAQMLATLAPQHTPRAGHPTPDHDTDNPDTPGAAAATTTHQRAPVDTQTRPTQQHSGLLG
ncbi:EspA/EspE family type VII secretion system effector [Mycobacterium marinum]|uniref:EspA/EspE family type VII secretion system effector n=1 Tax=Mycobacterium marinum TaxID=1781 RepID=UPI002359CD12|nr:EspA/EspE family type VII secretion system effector [Mycobacterium marinum]MDC8985521.1 EspA/EspE family type VII secretion system effector [Mycobacterium marinum]MDC9002835.1 EspA/EspE family type VII secretion system effector [Mycobacterium marinum]MDC9013558.1 EspA/EspE family type VII secretion system effector [Mycobacterium marinum]MDC9018908.1 EspA/EspE family type VII secretion system effector [Mycobacterium marinum]